MSPVLLLSPCTGLPRVAPISRHTSRHLTQPLPGCPARGDPAHLNGAKLEVLTRIIVDDRNKVIAQVPFLVTAMLVHILGGHQGSNMENSCRVGDTGLGARTGHLMLHLQAQVETSLQISLVFSSSSWLLSQRAGLGSRPT